MKNLHDILAKEIRNAPQGDCAILLSSGVDSASLLYLLLELGRNVHAYSFTLEDRESNDFVCAKSLALKNGVPFTPIYLPIDIPTLIKDVRLMAIYGARKKTDFECLWPFLYAYRRIEEPIIVTGIPADGHFCLSKKGQIHFKNNVDEFRELYFKNPNAGQRELRNKLAKIYEKYNLDPFYSIEICNYLKGYTWDELNKPKQKMPIRMMFPDKLYNIGIHKNLQKGDSGISQHFESLVYTDANIRRHKSVVGVFNDIIKDVQNAQVQLPLEFN